MIIQSDWQLSFDFFGSQPIVVEPSAAQVSGDAGLLPIRQLDEQLGLTRQFAAALTDRRHAGYVGHTFLDMTRARIYGILADYADQNDHDVLRSDPIFKLICGRSIDGPDLASQPTLSRFENAVGTKCFQALQDMFLDQFIASFAEPPRSLTLENAVSAWEQTAQPQRLFMADWYQAESWTKPRWVVIKCEAHAQGTNRRAVVTNRPGAFVLPGAAYDAYADRGESENRNKELKRGLQADRLSDHRYFANLFRLYLHAAAYNLLNHLRRTVADPPAEEAAVAHEVPAEALVGRQRRSWHNHRREHDPLGDGQPCTWRTRLIKVAARVTQSARRIVVELSSS